MKDKDKILKLLKDHFIQFKRFPSYRQIQSQLGYSSVNAVFRLMKQLVKEGYIKKDDDGTLVPDSLFLVPLKGSIPAGSPMFVESERDDSIDLYQYLLTLPKDIFCLVVKGDSMVEAGIMDGDIAYIDPHTQAKIGDIVAAYIDNEWTLKYFAVDDNGSLHLRPANKKYKPIYPKQLLEIGGVLIRTARDY